MNYTKLTDHIFKNGKFITPFNNLENYTEGKSWDYYRLPEYLWIGLILKYYGRDKGLQKLLLIVRKLYSILPTLNSLKISDIIKLDPLIQKKFYDYLEQEDVKESLLPLTIFITSTESPTFAESFFYPTMTIQDKCQKIVDALHNIMNPQSYESTDIKFIIIFSSIISGELNIPNSMLKMFENYPFYKHANEEMTVIRPTIRCIEIAISNINDTILDNEYVNNFWKCISKMTDCDLFTISFPQENRDITPYINNLYEILSYLTELFISVEPLDDKMNVLLGIATYSYKRFKEIADHNLFNSISSRSCIRVLIEDYIMMKYLVNNEVNHPNIWKEYQLYGIGLYKLILARHRDTKNNYNESHFDKNYIEALVNEFIKEDFIDMDTKYFDKQNIRKKSEEVDEKELYGLLYDYGSSFEHGMWGAIRESSLLKCNNPAHRYHCIPDLIDSNNLKSVLPDCIMVINKMIEFLNNIYGVPKDLLEKVVNFEL